MRPPCGCTQTWGLKTRKTREGSERLDAEGGVERACLGSKRVSTCFPSAYWVPGPGVTQRRWLAGPCSMGFPTARD